MSWTAKELVFDTQQKREIRHSFTAYRPNLGPTQPPVQWILGAVFLRAKPPGNEADHLPLLIHMSMTWCLIS
jgi:hypothetical protein